MMTNPHAITINIYQLFGFFKFSGSFKHTTYTQQGTLLDMKYIAHIPEYKAEVMLWFSKKPRFTGYFGYLDM